jgi:hypothetical protein
MAGPLRADVEMLNRSMEGMGESFARRRQEQDQNALKQQMLDAELERYKKATEHETRMEGKQDQANALAQQGAADKNDQQLLQDMIKVNPFLTDDSRTKANAYLQTHPKFGKVGIQLAKPAAPIPAQPGQSQRVRELQAAREYRDKAAALGPEGDLDLQKWYVSAAEDLENGPQSPEKTVTKDQPLDPNAPTTTTTVSQPARTFGRQRTPAAAAAPTGGAANPIQGELNAAREAILQGKEPEAVKQRYKQRTGMDFPG